MRRFFDRTLSREIYSTVSIRAFFLPILYIPIFLRRKKNPILIALIIYSVILSTGNSKINIERNTDVMNHGFE